MKESKLWSKTGRLVYRFHLWILLFSLALTLFFVWRIPHLQVSPDWWEFLPENSRAEEEYHRLTEDFSGASTPVYVLVEGNDRKEVIDYAGKLAAFLDGKEEIRSAGLREEKFFLRHGFLYLEAEKSQKAVQALNQPGVKTFLKDPTPTGFLHSIDKGIRQGGQKALSGENIDFDQWNRELDKARSFLSLVEESAAGKEVSPKEVEEFFLSLMGLEGTRETRSGPGFFLSPDGRSVLMGITPYGDLYSSIKREEEFVGKMKEWLRDFEGQNPSSHQVGMTGGAVLDAESISAMRNTLEFVTPLAAVGVILLFILLFRRFFLPLLSMIPLAMGIVWILGITEFLYGQLNTINTMIGALLIGLGIDFAIHTYGRFREERSQGVEMESTMETVFVEVGPGILTGALTTAAFFFAISLLSGKALQQLGILSGLGVIFFFFLLFVVYACILVLASRWLKEPEEGRAFSKMNSLSQIALFTTRHRKQVLAFALLVTVLSLVGFRNTAINYNIFASFARGLESWERTERMSKNFGLAPASAALATDNLERAREISRELEKKDLIKKVVSAADFIPPKQGQKLASLQKIRTEIKGIEPDFSSAFDEKEWKGALENLNDNLELLQGSIDLEVFRQKRGEEEKWLKFFSAFMNLRGRIYRLLKKAEKGKLAELHKSFQRIFQKNWKVFTAMASAEKITPETLPDSIRKKLVSQKGKYLITAYPIPEVFDSSEKMYRLLDHLDRASAESEIITGEAVLFVKFMEAILGNLEWALAAGIAAMMVILIIKFRRPRLVLLSLVPLTLGWIWTLGLMGLLGIKWGTMNIIAIVVIMGIGVDDAVHILHRYLYETEDEIDLSYGYTGKAILLTTLTTAWGFGSLALGSYGAFKPLSFVVVIGLTFFFLATLIVLPPLLEYSKIKEKIDSL